MKGESSRNMRLYHTGTRNSPGTLCHAECLNQAHGDVARENCADA